LNWRVHSERGRIPLSRQNGFRSGLMKLFGEGVRGVVK
jgi:hypothetical protein